MGMRMGEGGEEREERRRRDSAPVTDDWKVLFCRV